MITLLGFKLMITILIGFITFSVISSEDINEQPALFKIVLKEPVGLERIDEYIDCVLQIEMEPSGMKDFSIIAEDTNTGKLIPCQIYEKKFFAKENKMICSIIFPVSMEANEEKTIFLRSTCDKMSIPTDLNIKGNGSELMIDNQFYKADLTRSNQSEGKNHLSGQLRELLIKMDYNKLLFRSQNRMHWAPNFQRNGSEHYKTIADWDNPKINNIYEGPYVIITERQDRAPEHPEILLSACYKFYAQKPYFRFYSCMEMKQDIWLYLLRNDEMTMDTLFTHVAFQDQSNNIIDLSFSSRKKYLKDNPIGNENPWLCFYNQQKGYAFGSIRIKYNNDHQFGNTSPTFMPHTKISDGSGGGKYWNRRLIHECNTFVPKGSRYKEENAYLVFEISPEDKFYQIKYWAKRLRNPILVTFKN